MIKFEPQDVDKQFISIVIKDKTPIKRVLNYIKKLHPSIDLSFYKMDNEEMLLNLQNDINYGFSLNELRKSISKIAQATVAHFCVDLQEPTQRFAG